MKIGVKLIRNTFMLKACAWLTLLFLLSVLLVWQGASHGFLPALEDIGASSVGLALIAFWLLGMIAMLIHIATTVLSMVRSRAWYWLVASFFFAPVSTLYFFAFVTSATQ
jgi:hypothetical protein